MRIRTHSAVPAFLGYCANVHPGQTLADVTAAIGRFAKPVAAELGARELSLGLWLSRSALTGLEQTGVSVLKDALAEAGIFVCTLNGFPYGNFHAEVVKRAVYHPDLTTEPRRSYLLGLARVLSELLPEDAREGTISTLPIGHRAELESGALELAARELCGLARDLAELRDRTGRSIRICLEPEPGCALETTPDAVAFFGGPLAEAAQRSGAASAVAQHLGICYDTCHQAVAFEDACASIRRLVDAQIPIGKVQLSSALEVRDPSSARAREELSRFDEPRFLHQARALLPSGRVAAVDDLPEMAALPAEAPWRIHFHVPIHREIVGHITTTRPFLSEALAEFSRFDPLPHLEVETYTWSVLPEGERPKTDADLIRGLAAELDWVRGALT